MNTAYKIIDTNVLITDPEKAPYSFGPKKAGIRNVALIPISVYKELDHLKANSKNPDVARNAGMAISNLRKLQEKFKGNFFEGIEIAPNYMIKIESDPNILNYDKRGQTVLGPDTDSSLIRVASYYMERGSEVEIVSDDNGVQVIGRSLGLEVAPWRYYSAINSEVDIYRGWREIECDLETRIKFNSGGFSLSSEQLGVDNPRPNEYFVLKAPQGEHSSKVPVSEAKYQDGRIMSLDSYIKDHSPRAEARNSRQKFLMDAMRDPKIDLVFAIGPAGTGKTFLLLEGAISQIDIKNVRKMMSGEHAKAVGLQALKSIYHGDPIHRLKYEGLFIVRSGVGVKGEELGFLPGDQQKKIGPYFDPIYDNLEKILDIHKIEQADRQVYANGDVIKKATLYFMRGRSISNRIIIIDEAQNLSIMNMKLMLTRVSENTKVVLAGDFEQRDRDSYQDNGLSFANQAHIQDPTAATIYFKPEDVVRSERVRKTLEYFEQELRRRE